LYERKLDGERCLAYRRGRGVRLLSRNRLAVDSQYPELVDAFLAQAGDFVVDGEIVAFQGRQTSFARLQQRMHVRNPDEARRAATPVFFYLFDVVHAGGFDLTRVPLRHRKAILRAVLRFGDPLRLTTHRVRDGLRFYEDACSKGWEGLIAKRADSPYEPSRSKAWLKFKCVLEQEFVIVGYTDPQGSRTELGALLLGYFEGSDLVYAGKVGTGFDREMLRRLGDLIATARAAGLAVHARPAPPQGSALAGAVIGRRGGVLRVDDGRGAPPPPVPRASRRQGRARGRPGAAGLRPRTASS
jgi:ATP-dependent DNA ligase